MTEKIPGSCLCGAFKFEVEGPLADVRLCHCEICRRANGTAYSANCPVPVKHFKVLTDQSPVTEYESTPGVWRAFCSICGSPVYARVDADADTIRLRLGTFGKEASPNVVGHVWVSTKALWDRISDDLPHHSGSAQGPLVDDSLGGY